MGHGWREFYKACMLVKLACIIGAKFVRFAQSLIAINAACDALRDSGALIFFHWNCHVQLPSPCGGFARWRGFG